MERKMENNQKEILLVEDNPDDEELVLLALKKNNLENKVKVVRDGAEALEYLFGSTDGAELKRSPPKLILLDLYLPRVDGFEVLKKMKSHPEAKKIPVVVFSSSSHDKDIMRSYSLDVDGYIYKPTDIREFPEIVRQVGVQWLLAKEKPS